VQFLSRNAFEALAENLSMVVERITGGAPSLSVCVLRKTREADGVY
jgi:hypothetical protein